jgi:hypothetical protein
MKTQIKQKIKKDFYGRPIPKELFLVVVTKGRKTFQFGYTDYSDANEHYKKEIQDEASICSLCGVKTIIGFYCMYDGGEDIKCYRQLLLNGFDN